MGDSVEEQIVATENVDEEMADAPVEEQIASVSPAEEQSVPDPPIDHDSVMVIEHHNTVVETSLEHHHVEDHNAVVETPIEHHDHAEDHNAVVETPIEHHDHVEDDNKMLGTQIEHHNVEDDNKMLETSIEHHHIEDHDTVDEVEDHNTVVEISIEHHHTEDHNTVAENPIEHEQFEDHNTVVENPIEHHRVEDHDTVDETQIEHHQVEDYNTVVETSLEHQHVEDHSTVVETSIEHHHIEDRNTVVETPIEHHHVEDQNLPEDHSTAEEHHRMISGEPDPAINNHVEDHHNFHISVDPEEHHHVAEEDHMVSDLTDHHVDVDDHHMVTVAHASEHDESAVAHFEGEQMDSIHIIREDQIESFRMDADEENQGHMMVTGDEVAIMSNNHEMQVFEEDKLLMTPYEGETPPSKRRKKKSIVWDYFTIEPAGEGCRRACCNQCKQTFAYSTGSKVAGTSHLKRHIAKGTCQDRTTLGTPARSSGGPRKRYKTGSGAAAALGPVPFDPDRCRHEVARMIIMHDYPLHLVEHPGFLAFVRNLQPHFQMVSFDAVQGDCVATYLMEKQNLMKVVDAIPGRVCLSLDMWGSSQSVGYVFVTAHFIDSDWKLQRRLLNVVMEPYPDSHAALGHAVAVCLHDWSLENRLFSITLAQRLRDEEAALETLRPQLSVKNPLILGGQLVLTGCLARIFCAAAMDVLDEGKDSVRKVRETVKLVKTSDSHDEKFCELREQLLPRSERSLSVDDQTQWDTTYQMLSAASGLKEVFSLLHASDPDFRSASAPTEDDWARVETLCRHLKLLHDSAVILSSQPGRPTPVTFFHEVWKIQSELSRAAESESESDKFSAAVARRAKERVEQYWKENSLALAAAVVMDPRFKMKLVEFSFNKLYGAEEAAGLIRVVEDGIRELFEEYSAATPAAAEAAPAESNGLTDFDVYIMETARVQMKTEVEQYLEEALLARVHDFDVLGWWRLNKPKYPTLSKMATDILSLSVSASTSVFKTRPNEMDAYRSSLRPETLEALICAKDWLLPSDPATALLTMEY